MRLIFLLALFTTSAFAAPGDRQIRNPNQDGDLSICVNKGGTETCPITIDGATGTTTISEVSSPGVVPVGGMIVVMPTLDAAAYQPPATGIVDSFGFMRADGAQVPGSCTDCVLPIGTYTPNMVSMVVRGATTSCDGTVACNSASGGSDNVTPTGTVSQPTLTGDAVARSTWFATDGVTATFGGTDVARSTWFASGALSGTVNPANTSITGSAVTISSTFFKNEAVTINAHKHTLPFNGNDNGVVYWPTGGADVFGEGDALNFGNSRYAQTGTLGLVGTATATSKSVTATMNSSDNNKNLWAATGSYTPGGSVDIGPTSVAFGTGNDNKTDWNAGGNYTPAGSVTMDATDDNKADWAAAGNYTPTGTVSQPTFTGDSQSNLPAYQSVVWVIRVR